MAASQYINTFVKGWLVYKVAYMYLEFSVTTNQITELLTGLRRGKQNKRRLRVVHNDYLDL